MWVVDPKGIWTLDTGMIGRFSYTIYPSTNADGAYFAVRTTAFNGSVSSTVESDYSTLQDAKRACEDHLRRKLKLILERCGSVLEPVQGKLL